MDPAMLLAWKSTSLRWRIVGRFAARVLRPVTRYSSVVTKLFWASLREPGGSSVSAWSTRPPACCERAWIFWRSTGGWSPRGLAITLRSCWPCWAESFTSFATPFRYDVYWSSSWFRWQSRTTSVMTTMRIDREGDQQEQAAARPLQHRRGASAAGAAPRRAARGPAASSAPPAGGCSTRSGGGGGSAAGSSSRWSKSSSSGGGVLEAKRRRPDRGTSPVLAVSSTSSASRSRREKPRRRFGGSPGSGGSSAKAASKSGRSSSYSATATREWMVGRGRSAPGGGSGVEVGEGGLEPPSSCEH